MGRSSSLILVTFISLQVLGARIVEDEHNHPVVEIDCNNLAELNAIISSKHEYICTTSSESTNAYGYGSNNQDYIETTLYTAPEVDPIVYLRSDPVTSKFPGAPMRRISHSKPKKSSDCPRGTTFVSELQICTPNSRKKVKSHSKHVKKVVVDSKPKKSSDCPTGSTFISELQICNSNYRSLLNLDSQPNRVKTASKPKKPSDCPKGTTLVTDLQICVPYSNTKVNPRYNPRSNNYPIPYQGRRVKYESSYQRNVRESQDDFEDYKKDESNKDLEYDNDDEIKNDLEEDKDEESKEDFVDYLSDGLREVDFHGCTSEEIYLSELDICVPYNNCYPYDDC